MAKMLFNATHTEELRVAVVEQNKLQDLLLEQPGRAQKKANIYKGRITRIEPSLEAAFVDYGQERHGFLPLKEIASCYYPENADSNSSLSIKDILKEGQELLVQVDKEERGSKGAALSTQISLAGSYLVLMPNNPKGGGISRRIAGEERVALKETLNQLELPSEMSIIVRTAGVGKDLDNLRWDLNYLLTLWEAIQKVEAPTPTPSLIYQESDVVFRAIRDYLRPEIDEIIIDDKVTYEKIRKHIAWLHPEFVSHVNFYKDKKPLFVRYQVESQIDQVFQREISLPSGGSIMIDRTEALVSIDINSARSTKGVDIEATAFSTNLEATEEIARQLRLRDLGGLVVIDFIDMSENRHQREVEARLNEALKNDRARIQTGRISRFGLLEMSRQRLRSSVGETTQELCPRCHGRGTIRSVESLTISVMRFIEEYAGRNNTQQVNVQVPVEVASYLLNEKREDIAKLEQLNNVVIFIMPNPHLETPTVDISTLKKADKNLQKPSHQLIQLPPKEETSISNLREARAPAETPAIKDFMPTQPAPSSRSQPGKPTKQARKGVVTRVMEFLFGEEIKQAKQPTQNNRRQAQQNHSSSNRNRPQQSRRPQSNNNRQQKRKQDPSSNSGGQKQSKPNSNAGQRNPSNTQKTQQNRRTQNERNNQSRSKTSTAKNHEKKTNPQAKQQAEKTNTPNKPAENQKKGSPTSSQQQRKQQSSGQVKKPQEAQQQKASTQPVNKKAEEMEAKQLASTTTQRQKDKSKQQASDYVQVETNKPAESIRPAEPTKPKGKKRPPRQKQAAKPETREELVMVETQQNVTKENQKSSK